MLRGTKIKIILYYLAKTIINNIGFQSFLQLQTNGLKFGGLIC
jgi:hypothetical protein